MRIARLASYSALGRLIFPFDARFSHLDGKGERDGQARTGRQSDPRAFDVLVGTGWPAQRLPPGCDRRTS
ncbi:hypothetical protein PCAR4_510039 [Paraburkholderia caribensis]|nr:hypothetical protein PCAR4_510039 [Paraburkholderia caribensis]